MLQWVVFTLSRTKRLDLTKVLDAGKNWKCHSSDSNLGLRVTGGLTFGPEPGAIDKG